jgi:hypothetical protein
MEGRNILPYKPTYFCTTGVGVEEQFNASEITYFLFTP